MPTPIFDPIFRAALGEVSRKLTAERVNLAAPDQRIFDDLIANLQVLETATDPQTQTDTWNLIIGALSANNTGVSADAKPAHEIVVNATRDLQEDNNIRHWQFVNMMGSTYEAVTLLAERQKMSSASDDLKVYRDAREEYLAAKDDAVETIARDYSSVDELDNKYANAVSDERRYTEEVKQLEAQKEYREKSFQALMVAFQARTDENKLAAEAYQRTIDERDAQINVAKRAREDYDSFVEAMRLKEKQLRERAAEIENKRKALNDELAKLATNVDGETSATVNVVSELQQKHAEAKKGVDERMKALTKKPKSDIATRATELYGLMEGQLEQRRLKNQIAAFTTALQANPRMASEVEKQGDSYTRTDERNLNIIRKINTDTTRMGLQYLEMYNGLKRHYEQLDRVAVRYEVDKNGNVLRDAKGNPVRKQGYAQEFVAVCHSLKDLQHHANNIDSIYSTLINRALKDPSLNDKDHEALSDLRNAHFTYGAVNGQMHAAQDHLDAKQDELNKFCIAIYDESAQIKEQMADLQSDSQAKLRSSLLEKAQREEARLSEMNEAVETKRNESAAAFKALQQVTRERDLWFQTEKAHEHLKEAQAAKAKHRAVLDKLYNAHEKHEAMFRAAETAKQNMPEGKLNLKFFAGTAERLYSGLGTFVQTADVGRGDLNKFSDPNYDKRSYNSNEYNGMIDALTAAANKDALKEMRPEQMLETLATVRAAATRYLDAKHGQWFHWVPSVQRKVRLAYAEEVIRFCDQAVVGVTSVKERAESLENGYASSRLDTCVHADREQIRSFINTVVKDHVQQRRARSASRTLQNDQPQIGRKNS